MSEHCCHTENIDLKNTKNRALLIMFVVVLVVNLAMFFVEIIMGHIYKSSALIADSLDMLADAFVYGISLFAITKSDHTKAKVSLIKGFTMTILGLYVLYEIFMKFQNPTIPSGEIIYSVGFLALVANLICFYLLSRHRNTDINVKSAWICSRNDVLGNIGVIVAGLLVIYFSSPWPDILIGFAIAIVVLKSSFGIIRESWQKQSKAHSVL